MHVFVNNGPEQYYYRRGYTIHDKYNKPSRLTGPNGERRKCIELKIVSGNIHFPGETYKVSRNNGTMSHVQVLSFGPLHLVY